MKNVGWIYVVMLYSIYSLLLTACADDSLAHQEGICRTNDLVLTIKLPVSIEPQLSVAQGGLDPETDDQCQIRDIFVLQFNTDSRLVHVVNPLIGDRTAHPIVLKGKLRPSATAVKLVVLANLKAQGGDLAQWDAVSFLNQFEGKTEQEILESLVFSISAEEIWKLSTDGGRPLPMWGEIPFFDLEPENNKGCTLYRAVAKMGVQVDDSCDNFQLKEVYIYYANNQGYCAPVHTAPNADIHIQFTAPDVPVSASRFDTEHPAKYVLTTEEQERNEFFNQIYVAESDNLEIAAEEKPLKMVVGGLRDDGDELEYFCIDMAERESPEAPLVPFNLVRNHSYLFNIKEVNGPGEDTPEKALPHLTVDIEDYTAVYMRGVPDQYTLRTNQSLIRMTDNKDRSVHKMTAFTDLGEGWIIEKDDDMDWFSVTPERSAGNVECTLSIRARNDNRGTTREGNFYIVAGSIKKEVKVIMPQEETANCYIVGPGENEMVVTIKGNGKEGIYAEGGISLIPGKSHPTAQDIEDFVNMRPAYLRVLWETSQDLVNLIDANGNRVKNSRESKVALGAEANKIKYFVSTDGATVGGITGGNAVIGAFNEQDEVIWSWHIWVAPQMLTKDKKVSESCVEKWMVNDYDVMDRNIGALANRPIENGQISSSVASMGLLYQWGRKDPFIGASYSNGSGSKDVDRIGFGLLPVVHYYEEWQLMEDQLTYASQAIPKTIAHPTLLIYNKAKEKGLSFVLNDKDENQGQYLWGVSDGLNPETKNLGIKTIYDPSPVGFRVPPVDAFVFKALWDQPRWGIDYYNFLKTYTLYPGKTYTNEYPFAIGYTYNKNFYETAVGVLAPGESLTNDNVNGFIYNLSIYKAKMSREIYSSANDNWLFNLIYVPHRTNDMTSKRYQWGNEPKYSPYNYHGGELGSLYKGEYINNAPYYGFYVNYTAAWGEPLLAPETRWGQLDKGKTKGEYYYKLDPKEEKKCAWFPITAVYDPNHKGLDLNHVTIQKGFSVTVNSFLWTNTTVRKDKGVLPAAMFLHGTENNGWKGRSNGRHIHALLDDKIEAEPQYAGAVRCIRNRKKTIWDINSLTDSTTIKRVPGATTDITIVSVNADWKLVKPGAPWIKATPDNGPADYGKGQSIALRMVDDPSMLPPVGAETSLEFRIADGLFNRKVTIRVVE